MNIAWIAAIAIFVLIEKAIPAGRIIARVAGAAHGGCGTLVSGSEADPGTIGDRGTHSEADTEVRVLGALIEKEITTPDYYPLSLNALMAACNQSSNRYPVVHFDEGEVGAAADSLREKGLVHLVDRGESRVTKYRHVLYEAMNMGRPAIAVMCVLMLRGPQTVGEIRTRTNRLYDFSSLEDVETTLNSLMSGEMPLIVAPASADRPEGSPICTFAFRKRRSERTGSGARAGTGSDRQTREGSRRSEKAVRSIPKAVRVVGLLTSERAQTPIPVRLSP